MSHLLETARNDISLETGALLTGPVVFWLGGRGFILFSKALDITES